MGSDNASGHRPEYHRHVPEVPMRLVSLVLLSSLALTACRGTPDSGPDPSSVDEDADGSVFADDCNDDDATIYPGAAELCNSIDDDCDGTVDEDATDAATFYRDADGDGYGSSTDTVTGCEAPAGYVAQSDDCDDGDDSSYPGATEDDCSDPVDHNCDGSVGYADEDADGFAACEDCDDLSAEVNPDATEACDEIDNNCDGATDEAGATGETTWYADTDADGQGAPTTSTLACAQPDGYVDNAQDCNDTSALAFTGGVEVCDTLDNDCNGLIDDDATDAATWYLDGDQDGVGTASLSQQACAKPTGFVASNSDCDDSNAAAYPGNTEVCDDADNNCDGTTDEGFDKTWYVDTDADGFGNGTVSLQACDQPNGFVNVADDCNDADAAINPDADEVCNERDDDCDTLVDDDDDSTTGQPEWHPDADLDGYGDADSSTAACIKPDTYLDDDQDCDDSNDAIGPLANEVCDDVDNNCDGDVDEDSAIDASDWYADTDGDGYGVDTDVVTACEQPDGYVDVDGDCRPDDGDVYACDKKVFVTSTVYTGSLGGLEGADAKCQSHAEAAGLTGTFMAWLSSSSESPSTRFIRSDKPYVLVDGTVVANDWADLTDQSLANGITLTEEGNPVAKTSFCTANTTMVWSGTSAQGTALGSASNRCSDWTSTSGGSRWGHTEKTDRFWSEWCSGGSCNWEAPIYCFEQ